MTNHVDNLLELCKEQPFDTEKISSYITNNKMNAEEVTRTAIKLCDYGMFSYTEYVYRYEKEPQPEELLTYNWEQLFDVLIANGLDAELVICDNGTTHVTCENILDSIQFLDSGDLNVRILRNILTKGGTPNVVVEEIPFFEEVDADFFMDIQLGCYQHKWQLDNAFKFWLVLVGFGGLIKGGKSPVNMCDGKSTDILKEYEKFDYRIIYKTKDFELQIIEKATQNIVATA